MDQHICRSNDVKSKRKSTKSKGKAKNDNFVWTDDEVELLLNVVVEYKVKRTAENVDWESCITKYSDILDMFIAQYPSPENAEMIGKSFSHKEHELSKASLTAKLKQVRLKFRSAVDSWRKSGHGRVVLLYFELCEQIWDGSPATTTLPTGIETSEIQDELELSMLNSPSPASRSGTSPSRCGNPTSRASTPTSRASTPSTSTIELDDDERPENERRDLLDARLKGYRQEKLKRKLSIDSQLLSVAQDDVEIKKRLIEKLDNMDKQQANNMSKLTSNMEQLTGSIIEGFAMPRQVMLQPCAMPQQYTAPQPVYLDSYNRMPQHQHSATQEYGKY
ncbi:Hypothetical predicted protein, partial [Paramuricea clavata]